MITLFSSLKRFEGLFEIIQHNALESWNACSDISIVFIYDENSEPSPAEQYPKIKIKDITVNRYGVPLLNKMFTETAAQAKTDYICYINGDIILIDDFRTAVEKIPFNQFMLVGQRIDIDLTEKLVFADQWRQNLKKKLENEGELHADTGIDYFLMPTKMFKAFNMPDFAIGRPAWDNWMIRRARELRIPVVDATDFICVGHQNHDYSHHVGGKKDLWHGDQGEENRQMAGGLNKLMFIRDSTHRLTKEGDVVKNKKTPLHRRLWALASLNPIMNPFLNVYTNLRIQASNIKRYSFS